MLFKYLPLLFLLFASGMFAQTPMPLSAYPAVEIGKPAPGKMVRATLPEYAHTDVHHLIYLPKNYQAGKTYPLLVELTGNKWIHGNGEVEEAHLAYSATLGKDFILVVLPYVSKDHTRNEVKWWGDEEATASYAKELIPHIIEQYNGDKNCVILCGFSRGAIGTSFIGLHDDEIASLWTAFYTHDHFDGLQEWKGSKWGSPLSKFRAEARTRLLRAAGKPWFLSSGFGTEKYETYLKELGVDQRIRFTFNSVPIESYFKTIPNAYFKHPHTDCWALFDLPESAHLRQWLQERR